MSKLTLALCVLLLLGLSAGNSYGQQAGQSVSGTVLSPQGQAVEGAEVIVATPDKAAWPNVPANKRPPHKRGAATALTAPDGAFTVKLPADAGRLVIHHASGYAEIRPSALAENPRVKLEPWCRVEGVLKIGAKTAPAGMNVSLGNFSWSNNAARAHYGYSTTTDAEGRYVLDRVPAGLVKIDAKVSKTGAELVQYTGASPDKPTHFDVGGAGRPVVGKMILPSSIDLKRLNKWPGVDSQCYLRRDVPWPRAPRDLVDANGVAQDQEDGIREWRKTPEAVELYKNEYRCDFDPQPDGSFRFDDVPPGKYVLSLGFQPLVEGVQSEELASKEIEVIVPDSPAPPTDEPLDLGEIQLGNDGL